MPKVDPSARGSDIPRSRRQYLARRFGAVVVGALGLNRPGFLSTEIVQQINPILTIPTKFGSIRCKGGHGRLRWRASTFFTEEPETVKWLDSIEGSAILWDVGANVGLYSIYAAKSAGCKVLAIEPEAQNYALLLENIVLNEVQENIEATNLAISNAFGLGKLHLHALTKGGAYHQFSTGSTPWSSPTDGQVDAPVSQTQFGASLDDLIIRFHYPCPTHIKIDVDGEEPEIISGATHVLSQDRCASVLIETQRGDPQHASMVERMGELGYRCVSARSNWESRTNREREEEHPVVNMIFVKG